MATLRELEAGNNHSFLQLLPNVFVAVARRPARLTVAEYTNPMLGNQFGHSAVPGPLPPRVPLHNIEFCTAFMRSAILGRIFAKGLASQCASFWQMPGRPNTGHFRPAATGTHTADAAFRLPNASGFAAIWHVVFGQLVSSSHVL